MTKLTNVKGRIRYITDPKRQENLYATYGNVIKKFWSQLAKQNQRDFVESGTKGTCIEARELILMLPPSLIEYDHDDLLKYLTEIFSEKYNVGCQAALHHNHRKTNLHIHLIFSEREILDEPEVKIAKRNRFYNEKGKHVRTKKEILDAEGNIRSGCKIIKKGEVYEKNIFETKNPMFKSEDFLLQVKETYTDVLNTLVKNENEKLKIFQRGGPYLATQKIGKNNPKAAEIKANNYLKKEWNNLVDRGLIAGISEERLIEKKEKHIIVPVKESIKEHGKKPGKFAWILQKAIGMLRGFIDYMMKINEFEKDENGKPIIYKDYLFDATPKELPKEFKIPCPSAEKERLEFNRLKNIDEKLGQQNKKIYALEKSMGELEEKLGKTSKAFWHKKERNELETTIESKKIKLNQAKESLEVIPAQHGFANVATFKRAYNLAKKKLSAAEERQEDWKNQNGKPEQHTIRVRANAIRKRESIANRLEQNKQKLEHEKMVRKRKAIDRDSR